MKFSQYGATWTGRSISLESLMAEQESDGLLWAHAEDSGCESCYVEVAKWSNSRQRWERYVFCKCLDYRLPDLPDATDEETATEASRRINAIGWGSERSKVVPHFPNWQPEPEPSHATPNH